MLSQELEISLNQAVSEATKRRHGYVTLEHILLALASNKMAKAAIEGCGGDLSTLKKDLEEFLEETMENALVEGELPQPTIGFQRVLQRAAQHVQACGKKEIDGSNVLVSLYSEKDSYAVYFLEKQHITKPDVVEYVSHGVSDAEVYPLSSTTSSKEIPESGDDYQGGNDESTGGSEPSKNDPLSLYTINLCAKARNGEIDPLIGRDFEIERITHILSRRRKNNPLLVGEAGVGKTAIAEGLALNIVEGNVPNKLKKTEIFSLDMGSLLAGSKFRGDFEQRLKGVMKSLQKVNDSILFIDEIHTIIGAGSTGGGSMDASNILKPSLAKGEIRCIGSTTYKEFRKHIENDHALARRFQKIDVSEPSIQDSVDILNGIKSYYEEFHNVNYTDEAIKEAVDLSVRYLPDKRLPDKAIDIIDESAAKSCIENNNDSETVIIGPELIQATVSKMAKIPIVKITESEKEKIINLEFSLKDRVFGQDKAIESLSSAIKLSRSGLADPNKPVGSFLFSGPTGVGKTELAKQLAGTLNINFERFDMSEYMEKHSVSRLIGAPPGYVGFDQGGLLTDALFKNPYSVILLDEIEKAHLDLQNILLQVMDHGRLTDNNGRESDFRNAILIMTTNAGARELSQSAIGFTKVSSVSELSLSNEVKQMFSPEFRNRLTEIITFQHLEIKTIKSVTNKFIEEIRVHLKSKDIHLEISDPALNWLAETGYDKVFGARPISRLIEKTIKKPISELLLSESYKSGDIFYISKEKNELKVVIKK